MKQDIKKLLGLQNIWIDGWDIGDNEVVVKVRSPRKYCMCPNCEKSTKKIHQYKTRRIKHSVWQDKIVILLFRQRRFFCKRCQKAFTEHIPGIDKRSTTQNFRNILLKNMSRSSLQYAMDNSNVSSSMLYDVLLENYENQKIDWDKQGNEITLGIDEHNYRGRRMVLTVTNITKGELLKIEKDDRIETVKDFLRNCDKSRIQEICIDMKRGFLNAALKEVPHADVTVDKFHVVSYANKMVDEVRSLVVGKNMKIRRALFKGKEKLSNYEKERLSFAFKKYKKFPSLYEAYFVKEKVRDFYKSKNMREGERRLSQIIMFCEESNSKYIKDFGKTLVRWKKHILNYFIRRSTNAFTEGVHTKIKMIKRMSFGFRNVHHYIAKISLAFLPFLIENHHTF